MNNDISPETIKKLDPAKEDTIFDIFVYSEDDMRPSLEKPMEQNGYICATDTHIAIRIRKEMLNGTYECRESPNFARVFPAGKREFFITHRAIADAIAKCGLDEVMYVDCPECDGTGQVDWYYHDDNGDTHTREGECPVCGGDGNAFNGAKRYIFFDKEYCFQAHYLIRILKAMRLFGADAVWVTPNNAHGWLFEPCEGVEIVLMPRSTYLPKVKPSAKIDLVKKI